MPTFAGSGHMRSHGPIRHKGSFGSKFFTPMGGFPNGKPPVECPKKTRPSHFQKWVEKYYKLGDPYDHLVSFKQVVRAEQITDPHTQVEGFGLTLEIKALSWFQILEPNAYSDFSTLEKEFIAAFSNMGVKHNIEG